MSNDDFLIFSSDVGTEEGCLSAFVERKGGQEKGREVGTRSWKEGVVAAFQV